MTTRTVRGLIVGCVASVALGGYAGPASGSDAGPSDRAIPEVSANDVFFNLIRKVNAGKRAEVRTFASKSAVRHLFHARKLGYRFDKPMSECTQNEDKPANRYECATAHRVGGQLTGSVYVVLKKLDSGFRVVRADVSYGE